jgi:hypothetical protein
VIRSLPLRPRVLGSGTPFSLLLGLQETDPLVGCAGWIQDSLPKVQWSDQRRRLRRESVQLQGTDALEKGVGTCGGHNRQSKSYSLYRYAGQLARGAEPPSIFPRRGSQGDDGAQDDGSDFEEEEIQGAGGTAALEKDAMQCGPPLTHVSRGRPVKKRMNKGEMRRKLGGHNFGELPDIPDRAPPRCSTCVGLCHYASSLSHPSVKHPKAAETILTRILSTWMQTPFPTFPPHTALRGSLSSYPSPVENHARKSVPLHLSYLQEPIVENAISGAGRTHGVDSQDHDRRNREFYRPSPWNRHQTPRLCSYPVLN